MVCVCDTHGIEENVLKVSVEKFEGKVCLEELDVNGSMHLNKRRKI